MEDPCGDRAVIRTSAHLNHQHASSVSYILLTSSLDRENDAAIISSAPATKPCVVDSGRSEDMDLACMCVDQKNGDAAI